MEHQPRSITKSCFQHPFKFPHQHIMFKSKTTPKKPKVQQLKAMDDQTISLVLRGCKLARDLESNLPNLANQPNLLSNSIDRIIKVFSAARTRVYDHDHPSSTSSYLHSMLALEQQQIGTSHVEEWLRSNPQAMDMIQTQLVADQREARSGGNIDVRHSEDEVRGVQGMEIASASGMNTGSSSQRPRRRKDQGLISKMTVPAPRIGNTEIPPEDGYTWRKYGQKEIMGCRFPRGYYRCTHQKMYSCPAKKQVQRLDHDPLTFEVMYRGEHTCHMSATAPSIPPPPPSDHHIAQENMAQTASLATSPPTTSLWLSMDLNPIGGGGGSSSSGMMGGGRGDGVGTSTTTRYGKEVDFPVVDFADAMFNSGSSSSTSMDFIFHSAGNKWEPEDKKN